jgi:hypothetical protein
VQVDGPFYVGWRQYNQYLLNVGLDRNNRPVPSVMYYNYTGTWQPSMAPGVIIFRPFLYDETTGYRENTPALSTLQVYPNPASERIYFRLPDANPGDRVLLEVFDSSGRMAISRMVETNSLHTGSLPPGIYYLRAHTSDASYYSKILINR